MEQIVLYGVSFDADGDVHITYNIPNDDVKAPGLAVMHTLMVPAGYDYDDEITAVLDAVYALIRDVREDWDNLPPAAGTP